MERCGKIITGRLILGCCTAILALGTPSLAEVSLPSVLSDHMVLQRDSSVPVWGMAEAGEQITVTFKGQLVEAVTDEDGQWRVDLQPMSADAAPATMTITGSATPQPLELTDVLVGEVWLCSGQSNMEFALQISESGTQTITDSADTQLRLFHVPRTAVIGEQFTCPGTWKESGPSSSAGFTAVGYYFGKQLREELGVPIGLIQSAWGGTPAESWTTHDSLVGHEETRPIVTRFEEMSGDYERRQAVYEEQVASFNRRKKQAGLPERHEDPQNTGYTKGYADTAFDDSGWEVMNIPRRWESVAGMENVDGIVWFRRKVTIPDEWAGRDLLLALGVIDDLDVAYFNGQQVGQTGLNTPNYWSHQRAYPVPADSVVAGEMVVAVRAFDVLGMGGMMGPAPQIRVYLKDDPESSIEISGEWRYHIEHALDPNLLAANPGHLPVPPMNPTNPNGPSVLYNSMIAPLAPYGIRGAVWYQGESNAGRAKQYRTLLPMMIDDWRSAWGRDDFPFGIVQISSFMAVSDEPTDEGWVRLRDAQQIVAKTIPHAGLAVTTDIGNASDVHPRNKHDVGDRLARWALHDVYGRDDVLPAGPTYQSMQMEDDRIVIMYDHVGTGLMTRYGQALGGFTIAGEDRIFHWAQTKITDDTVEVWSDDVPHPVAVRYAWQNNPVRANLFNEEGLPAGQFRTDDWAGPADGDR